MIFLKMPNPTPEIRNYLAWSVAWTFGVLKVLQVILTVTKVDIQRLRTGIDNFFFL